MITKSCKERYVPHEEVERQIQDVRVVMQYCENETECRRVLLLQFFNEKFDIALCRGRCNNCANREVLVEQDVTKEARDIVELVKRLEAQNLTQEQCRSVFQGKAITKGSFNQYSFFGAGSHLTKDVAEHLFNKLLFHDVLREVSLPNGSGWHSMYLKVCIFAMHVTFLLNPLQIGPKADDFLRMKAFRLKCRPKAAKVVTEKSISRRGKKKTS